MIKICELDKYPVKKANDISKYFLMRILSIS